MANQVKTSLQTTSQTTFQRNLTLKQWQRYSTTYPSILNGFLVSVCQILQSLAKTVLQSRSLSSLLHHLSSNFTSENFISRHLLRNIFPLLVDHDYRRNRSLRNLGHDHTRGTQWSKCLYRPTADNFPNDNFKLGDKSYFIQHHNMAEDFLLEPTWAQYTPFNVYTASNSGQEKRTSGCPFAHLWQWIKMLAAS